MASLIGSYSLFFGLGCSLLVVIFSLKDLKNLNNLDNKILSLIFLQFFLVVLSFFGLIISFVNSDFSNLTVFNHSHTTKPLFYKISGTWGNHEGSLLLWLLVLTLFIFIFLLKTKNLSKNYRILTLLFQQIIIVGFFIFLLSSSNPFNFIFPTPKEGLGLNPILQDPALAIHPPVLYLGYVGSSIIFSSSLSATVLKGVNKEWATHIKSWVFISWIFLTLGILLGSIWAYYELGWGGFWFWDPVENSSLMPWLAATALLHSLNVLLKRNFLKSWTLLLALFAFTFSLIGTFIVRSGIIASVHAFAVDPERGIYLLLIILFLFSFAFVLYIYRFKNFSGNAVFGIYSRESGLIFNNLLLTVSALVIFLGTIWPFIIEVFLGEQISVGPPYFNLSLAPFAFIMGIFLPLGASIKWKRDFVLPSIHRLQIAFYISVATAAVIVFIFKNPSFLLFTGGALCVWIIIGSITDLRSRFKNINLPSKMSSSITFILTRTEFGKNISHMGVGLLIFGIAAVSTLEKEIIKEVQVGDRFILEGYEITFNGVKREARSNYISDVASLSINGEAGTFALFPEKRFYSSQETVTSEVAIKKYISQDVYAVLGDFRKPKDSSENYWVLRIYIKPFINFIWFGSFFVALGGFISLFTKKRNFSKNVEI